MNTDQANLQAAQLIIEELHRYGVNYFCICPGSRSTPLAVALAQETRVAQVVHHDERGAAYHALGYTRATGQPTVVITTSGTAAANLFPAVVEASLDHLPLVVITADRPPELQDCGANQTINQTRLFGDYVRAFVDPGCPDDIDDLASVVTAVDKALNACCHGTAKPGPVHINCPYRKPLVPEPSETKPLDMVSLLVHPSLSDWAESEQPLNRSTAIDRTMPGEVARELAGIVGKTKSGLLMIGRLENDSDRQEALNLSQTLGWPTVTDITSGLSLYNSQYLAHHHDLPLASEKFCDTHPVDTVLHIGGQFVSKHLLDFLGRSKPANYIHNSTDSKLFDPAHVVTRTHSYDNASFCHELALKIKASTGMAQTDDWLAGTKKINTILDDTIDNSDAFTEPVIARMISQAQSAATALFAASSMPIRDLDMFAAHISGIVPVGSNRGVSGIDGTLASAAGYAIGLGQLTTLLIGDLAFLHDLSSLPLITELPASLVIVVINNNGGRIFEQLPIAEHNKIIEPYFVAPHDLTFEKIAEAFGIDYRQVTTSDQFQSVYTKAQTAERPIIIEAIVDPNRSREHRQTIINTVRATIDKL
ncbi:MAG: 2-succinyl-5-enolpyruvyl-6-hydroxy-3-cyclohexene-1-carboxylic-acid synthase [candidate division Zixibacteria bacterium]|nr:2-succinyl-5-enolpyruvyl-6-hydroxy-3-cyclohexene-1-carboxylic-acid synthase [candidate division Zixibacteria bacterium]